MVTEATSTDEKLQALRYAAPGDGKRAGVILGGVDSALLLKSRTTSSARTRSPRLVFQAPMRRRK